MVLREEESKEKTTHIRVSSFSWVKLNQLKSPGDSFNDIIERLLLFYEENNDE